MIGMGNTRRYWSACCQTEEWYASLGDNTLADAILDRLMHNTHRLSRKGESMKKRRSELTQSEQSS